jgi:hypothetical protein
MQIELWDGWSHPRNIDVRGSNLWVRGEPELRRIAGPKQLSTDLTVGRGTDQTIVLREALVSREALTFWRQADGWHVRTLNKHGVEHRRWSQPWQPNLPLNTTEFLEPGEHAFIIPGGDRWTRTFCLLVSIDESETPTAANFHDAATPVGVDASITPQPHLTEPPTSLGHRLRAFCDVYQEFLIWPPRHRPEVISDNKLIRAGRPDPASAVAAVIRYAATLGYMLGDSVTKRADDLPFFLARAGVLDFRQHARPRPPG